MNDTEYHENQVAARSPARVALAEHLAAVADAGRKVEELNVPVERARAAHTEADDAVRECSAALAEIDQAEHRAMVAAAETGEDIAGPVRAKERATAEGRLAAARRREQMARQVVDQVSTPMHAARAELVGLQDKTAELVAGVLIEEHAAALDAVSDAITRLRQAELDVDALRAIIAGHGRQLADRGKTEAALPLFRAAEVLGERNASRPRYEPGSPRAAFEREGWWMEFSAELARDPDARSHARMSSGVKEALAEYDAMNRRLDGLAHDRRAHDAGVGGSAAVN
jgi:hypothetical protein